MSESTFFTFPSQYIFRYLHTYMAHRIAQEQSFNALEKFKFKINLRSIKGIIVLLKENRFLVYFIEWGSLDKY